MSSLFKFKQFSVRHDRSSMKVGTDGVLIAAWVKIQECARIIDIGAGTGLISLIIAQRTQGKSLIDAVEADSEACKDAEFNISNSPWNESIRLHHKRIQEFTSQHQYDLIITNPPYFINSLKPPNKGREEARHTENLEFADIISFTKNYLTKDGRLALILPPSEGQRFKVMMKEAGFFITRQCEFRTRREKPAERYLLEFSRSHREEIREELVLYENGNIWTKDYIELTKDLYIIL